MNTYNTIWLCGLRIFVYCVCVVVTQSRLISVTPWTATHQAALSRQEYSSGLPFPSPGDPPKPGSHPYMTTGKTIALTRWTFVGKVMSLLFYMLSRLVITFLPRSKCLLISWLQSPSAVILEPK